MRILFDQGTPVPLRRHLHPHSVDTVSELGWSAMTNGKLLATAVRAGFDIFVTTDQNLKYQQNLGSIHLGIVVLLSTSCPRILNRYKDILAAIDTVKTGQLIKVTF
jgi:hypothetical protein